MHKNDWHTRKCPKISVVGQNIFLLPLPRVKFQFYSPNHNTLFPKGTCYNSSFRPPNQSVGKKEKEQSSCRKSAGKLWRCLVAQKCTNFHNDGRKLAAMLPFPSSQDELAIKAQRRQGRERAFKRPSALAAAALENYCDPNELPFYCRMGVAAIISFVQSRERERERTLQGSARRGDDAL